MFVSQSISLCTGNAPTLIHFLRCKGYIILAKTTHMCGVQCCALLSSAVVRRLNLHFQSNIFNTFLSNSFQCLFITYQEPQTLFVTSIESKRGWDGARHSKTMLPTRKQCWKCWMYVCIFFCFLSYLTYFQQTLHLCIHIMRHETKGYNSNRQI